MMDQCRTLDWFGTGANAAVEAIKMLTNKHDVCLSVMWKGCVSQRWQGQPHKRSISLIMLWSGSCREEKMTFVEDLENRNAPWCAGCGETATGKRRKIINNLLSRIC